MSYSIPLQDIYTALLSWLLSPACPEQVNARTGHKIKVGRGGTAFRVDLSDGILPTVGVRKLFPKSAAAEVAWYLSGEQDVTWMRRHAPLWDKFVEEDRTTVLSAYGYRWRKHFGRDQIGQALDALRKDPSDRRVYISAWDPAMDGLGAHGQRNVPCPTSFNLYIIDGELHSSLYLRSSDVFVGLPYDVMGHALLMDALAAELGPHVLPGVMHVTLAHAHLYEDHYEMAKQCVSSPLKQDLVVPRIGLPAWSVTEIVAERDAYVSTVAAVARAADWPAFNPKPFVVE